MNHHIPITPRMRQQQLRSRIQGMTWVLIIGSFLAGITALPLASELDIAVRFAATKLSALTGLVNWLTVVRDALHDVYGKYPFIAYGTDWLAFAHIVIAIAFAGGLTHPLRNAWIYKWGALVSVLVIPWALICGEVRHIPPRTGGLSSSDYGVSTFKPRRSTLSVAGSKPAFSPST
jgi:hypothetical protein